MTILYDLLVLLATVVFITITSLYDLTFPHFQYRYKGRCHEWKHKISIITPTTHRPFAEEL